jgi:DNA-binding NarL/FixJ family response regulator
MNTGGRAAGSDQTCHAEFKTGAERAMNAALEEVAEITVLVVDDHDLFRTGLASLLGAHGDIEVVGQASGGRMGIRLAKELAPDVVLMDLRMPDVDGVEATRAIIEGLPGARVVALTVASEDGDVAEAVRAGACGFLVKDTPVDDIVVAVRAAAQGAAWLSPRAADAILGRVREGSEAVAQEGGPFDLLSPRELDVLRLMAQGLENSEIARELNISPRTAKNHVSSILLKLGFPNRIQAAIYAVRGGLE